MINQTIKGDLVDLALKGEFDVVVHGCNCFCHMGAGIAKQFRNKVPGVYSVDVQNGKLGFATKLGTYTAKRLDEGTLVVNAYTQFEYVKPAHGINLDYKAVKDVFWRLNSDFPGQSVGIPKIGAGLAGGDWETIRTIINEVTPQLDITLVEFNG